MRIDIHRIIAVLLLAAVVITWASPISENYRHRPPRRQNTKRDQQLLGRMGKINSRKMKNNLRADREEEQRSQHWLQQHTNEIKTLREEGGECCPAEEEMVQMHGGRNNAGILITLFSGSSPQRFYEVSCRKDVLNKPCRGLDKRITNQSRCIQNHSYSYALVVDKEGVEAEHDGRTVRKTGYKLDYIKIRTGCSCHIQPKSKPNKNEEEREKRREAKRRNHRRRHPLAELDET